MNEKEIKKLLNQDYNRENWKKLVSEIFPNRDFFSVEDDISELYTEKQLDEIENIVKFGDITLNDDTEFALFEVKLKKNKNIARNRVNLRSLIAKLITPGISDGAFVVFYAENQKDWRFSFIHKQIKYGDGEELKIETALKRYTYVLGENETCKTPAKQFNILTEKQEIKLEDILEAFSVEKLSKEFFDKYKQFYYDFTNNILQNKSKRALFEDEKQINNFVKKMLGRIVFLFFLQKKGWLGIGSDFSKNPDAENYGEGDFKFFRNLLENSEKNQMFFANYLAPLFYETLNTERENDICTIQNKNFGKVPFLNGGLFEIDFEKYHLLTFDYKDFDNLFAFFEEYNFTIDENSIDDFDIGIDPEMLGHIFENLLEDNKDKGAFYTPKEIVHYMCQESLTEYLKTKIDNPEATKSIENLLRNKKIDDFMANNASEIDKYLDDVKICDPAIGSGAFPIGLLLEIFEAKHYLHSYAHPRKSWIPAKVKQNIIQNSIYGVDIESGAVDIARLRFWLSLIVDEEIEEGEKPKPLPNLDYKIVVGNSLVSKFEDEILEINWKITQNTALKQSRPDLFERINENIKNIYEAQNNFFHSVADKTKLKLEIRDFKIELLETLIKIEKQKLIESGIDPQNAINKKDLVKITERKIKYDSFSKLISKLQTLKTQPEKPLNYFDWQLNFPEILNPLFANENNNSQVEIANAQIIALNKQIEAINLHLKQHDIDVYIINLQTNIAQSQISSIKEQIRKIEKRISEIYGELFSVGKNVVKEPDLSFTYQIKSINNGISEINKKVKLLNSKLSKSDIYNKLGFDIIIGNPPYIKEYTSKDAFYGFKETSKYYQGKMDIWYGFACKGLDMTKQNTGILSFIATNNWTTNSGASLMRKRIVENAQILNILDFKNYKIFENASIQTMIMTFKNKKVLEYTFDYRKITHLSPVYKHVLLLLNKIKTNDNQIFDYPFKIENFKGKTLTFNTPEIEKILDKIKNEGIITLDEKKEVAQGMVLPQDYVINKTLKILGHDFNLGDGIFCLSIAEKESLNLNKKEEQLIKPYFTSKNFSKYYANPNNTEWIIYTASEFKKIEKIKPYPNIKQHLDKFKKVITSDNKPYGLHRARVEDFFKGEKIIVQRKCPNEPIFTYTDFDTYVSATFYVIKTSRINQKYLTALLNSKLIAFWLKYRGKMQGNNYQIDKEPILNIPIKQPENTEIFEEKVDEILKLKEQDKDTSVLEAEIDTMVYQLYGLTEEEIEIVENPEKAKQRQQAQKELEAKRTEQAKQIFAQIAKGETQTQEFKSTLRYCLRQKSPQKYIEHEVMKNIAAFMNSKGGTLFIGVDDDKNILGLENDFSTFKKSDKIDEFQKHLDNIIQNYLGNYVHELLNISFPEIDDKIICTIEVKQASSHKMLINISKGKEEEFYIRRSASAVKLSPSEMLQYINEHWK